MKPILQRLFSLCGVVLFCLMAWSQPALAQTPEIDVQGNGMSIADGSTTPSVANGTYLGFIDVDTPATPQTFTILNTGTGDLTINSVMLSGLHNLDFAITGITTPITIGPNSSTTFVVDFIPSGVGDRAATVDIVSNDVDESPYTFDIGGEGYPPGEAVGFLYITKITQPQGGSGFTFVHDIEAPYTFTLDDGFSEGFEVVPGTYTITEMLPADWVLDFVECFSGSGQPGRVSSAGGGGNFAVNGNSLTVTVAEFENADCYFYNAQRQIDKETQSPNVAAGEVATYTIAMTNTEQFVIPGVNITDTLPAGFTYRATINISENNATRTSPINPTIGDTEPIWGAWDVAAGGSLLLQFTVDVSTTVPPGTYDNAACLLFVEGPLDCDFGLVEVDEDVTVSPPLGSITIVKQATPNDGSSFDFNFDGQSASTFSLNTGTSQTLSNLLPTTYTIVELVPDAWLLTDVACDGDVSTTQITNGISVELNGQDITCTFTNAKRPTLTVTKVVVNDNVGTGVASDFTLNVAATNPSPASFAGNTDGVTVTLDAGSYSITETAASGYAVSYSAECAGTIALGESKSCTVTNDDIPLGSGTITIVKAASPESSQPFSFSSPTLGNFTLIDDGSGTDRQLFVVNANTSHAITETLPSGWTLQGATCDNGDSVNAIFVAEGAGVICTFTNAAIPGSIAVTKTPSLDVAVISETITYTYRVRNSGGVTLTEVVATDDKLGSITLANTTLAPNQETTGTASTTVLTGDLPGPLVNTVMVTGTPPVGPVATANAQASVTLVNASIALVKTVGSDGDGPACGDSATIEVLVNRPVAYCYTVTNTGNVPLVSHSLTDDKLGSIFADKAFTLAPGQSINNVQLGESVTATLTAETTNVATWTAQTADLANVPAASAAADAQTQRQIQRVISVQATASATVQILPDVGAPTAIEEINEPAELKHFYLPLLTR